MSFLFKRQSPSELIRQNKRLIDRSIRDLDRERAALETQERRLVADLKKSAAAGQMNVVRIMAKDLVRTRNYISKFFNMRAMLQAVNLRLQTMKSSQAISEAMMGVTKAMKSMNRSVNLPSLQKIMATFEKESMTYEMKEELMNDALDDVTETDLQESDDIVNQVLDELGIQFNEGLSNAPTTKLNKPSMQQEPSNADKELEERLLNLRKV